jgi:hypothetical protein
LHFWHFGKLENSANTASPARRPSLPDAQRRQYISGVNNCKDGGTGRWSLVTGKRGGLKTTIAGDKR